MKMKKTQGIASKALLSVAGFAAFGLTLTPPSAEAVPAFARQMGMQCSMCHSIAFPALNSFGRAFKSSGYTMTGAQQQIKGENFAMPSTLNMSMISKLRYQTGAITETSPSEYDVKDIDDNKQTIVSETDTKYKDGGLVVWPDEQALLIGGKVADGIGALVEWGSGEGALGYKLLFEAVKMGNTRITIVPFSTDALGPGYGMELLNTGAQRSQRMIEDRKSYSASQSLDVGAGPATGLTVAITDPAYFVNLTQYTPGFGNENMGAKITDLATYARAAITPRIAGFDTGFGVQVKTGGVTNNAGATIDVDGYVVDAQAEGKVAGRDFAAYLSYGEAKKDGKVKGFTADKSTNIGLVMGIVPNVNGYIGASSSKDDVGKNTSTSTVGVAWLMRQNMKFELYQSMPNRGNDTTTLQMFTAW